MLRKMLPPEYLNPILANFHVEMRKPIFTADCWRSFFIIVVGTLLLLLYRAKKLKAVYMVLGVCLLSLIDMWTVNKRYLNDEMFVEKSQRDAPQPMTATDQQILQDKSLDYRVLNLHSPTHSTKTTPRSIIRASAVIMLPNCAATRR